MLKHIGISVNEKNEIEKFYKEILNFEIDYDFVIESHIAKQIFNIEKAIPVFVIKNKDLVLEVFVVNEKIKSTFNHICLELENRDEIIKKVKKDNYFCDKIKSKNKGETYFVKDKSGNLFELKEKV